MQPYDPTMLELESMLMQLESNPELMQMMAQFGVILSTYKQEIFTDTKDFQLAMARAEK